MTDEEKHAHDLATANYTQKLNTMTDEGVLLSALAILILNGKASKYDLSAQDAATVYQCLHRADPSFSW